MLPSVSIRIKWGSCRPNGLRITITTWLVSWLPRNIRFDHGATLQVLLVVFRVLPGEHVYFIEPQQSILETNAAHDPEPKKGVTLHSVSL